MESYTLTAEDFQRIGSWESTSGVLNTYDYAQRMAAMANAKIAPLVAENERLKAQVLTDAERRCIESWKRDELIWLDQEKELKAEITALKAKLEVADECLEQIALYGITRPLEMGEGDDGDGHFKNIALGLIRRAARTRARIEELGRKA